MNILLKIIILIFIVISFILPLPTVITFDISQGMSALEAANILEQKGLVKSQEIFLLMLKMTNSTKKIKAGTYKLSERINYLSLINKIVHGSEFYIFVSIPEGFTTEQIADRLEKKEIISCADDFVNYVEKNNLRGYLFPDTYNFSKNFSIEKVVEIMRRQFDNVFNEEYRDRTSELGFSINEIVTLASLIEKEAKVPSERPIISDIFHKRLKKRIYLESCASVLFALGKHKSRLTYKDLEVNSPYNTYRHFGLPPTPICNPGRDSIRAALYPAKTEYLYFFAKGDGSHIFSATYEQHLKKQKNY